MVLHTAGNLNNLQADLFELLAEPSNPAEATDNISIEGHGRKTIRTRRVSPAHMDSNSSLRPIPLPQVHVHLSLPSVKGNEVVLYQHQLPPALLRPKLKSHSLPNSTSSSPRFGQSSLLGKTSRDYKCQKTPREGNMALDNVNAGSIIARVEKDLCRSKSCGDGRSCSPPSVEFDAVSEKWVHANSKTKSFKGTSPRQEKADEDEEPQSKICQGTEEEFKCGALCLFLPGFGKAKPVRAKTKPEQGHEHPTSTDQLPSNNNSVISRSVSLEKFECASWASSAIIASSNNNHKEDGGDSSTNLYFDLPFEMIRGSEDNVISPVTAAFIFDNKEPKGVLKTSRSTRVNTSARNSHESPRHVRFSVSTSPRSYPDSPSSCITPRLRKAREEFNAFLEAQSA